MSVVSEDVKIGDFLRKMKDAVCYRAFVFGAIVDNREFEQWQILHISYKKLKYQN